MMEARFCDCDWGGEEPLFCTVSMPKARKRHRCIECGEAIHPGTPYERVTGKWDDTIDTMATCMTCTRIRRDYCAPYGDLREVVFDLLGVDLVTGKVRDG